MIHAQCAPRPGHENAGAALLALARGTVAEHLQGSRAHGPEHPWLDEPGACFVTIHNQGRLHGCIGSLVAHEKLRTNVQRNAFKAAIELPYGPKLSPASLPQLHFEVSVLSPLETLVCTNEAALFAELTPGKHGLLLEESSHRSVFLPQVWEQLPRPEDFLAQLRQKAGLSRKGWSPQLSFQRFTVEAFEETHAPS